MHTHTRAHTCTTDSFYTTHQSSYSGVCCCCYGTDPCVQREAATLDVWSLVLHSGEGYTHTVMCCACTYAVLYMYTHACTVHASVHTYICTYVHTYYMYMHIQTRMPLTCRALPPDNHYILYTVCTVLIHNSKCYVYAIIRMLFLACLKVVVVTQIFNNALVFHEMILNHLYADGFIRWLLLSSYL